MRRTLKDSKKDARKFRASFNFVSYLNNQENVYHFRFLGEPKALNPSHALQPVVVSAKEGNYIASNLILFSFANCSAELPIFPIIVKLEQFLKAFCAI